MTVMPFTPDFSRHAGLIDHDLMRRSRVAVIGTGGAAGLVALLVRSGIRQLTFIDPDTVSAANPATQAHDLTSVGMPKVEALARRLAVIDPTVSGRTFACRYEDLSETAHTALWSADLVLAMTDRFATQALINRDAVAKGTDTIFAIAYPETAGVEITGTFADTVAAGGGCHRCHVKSRYDAYAAGYQNPAVLASHALAAEYLNSLLALIAVGRLHQRAGSQLAIARIAERFAARPCLMSRLDPAFLADPGAAFAGVEPALSLFTTKLWDLDTPDTWICPDCGTRGPVVQMRAHALDPFNPQP